MYFCYIRPSIMNLVISENQTTRLACFFTTILAWHSFFSEQVLRSIQNWEMLICSYTQARYSYCHTFSFQVLIGTNSSTWKLKHCPLISFCADIQKIINHILANKNKFIGQQHIGTNMFFQASRITMTLTNDGLRT